MSPLSRRSTKVHDRRRGLRSCFSQAARFSSPSTSCLAIVSRHFGEWMPARTSAPNRSGSLFRKGFHITNPLSLCNGPELKCKSIGPAQADQNSPVPTGRQLSRPTRSARLIFTASPRLGRVFTNGRPAPVSTSHVKVLTTEPEDVPVGRRRIAYTQMVPRIGSQIDARKHIF